MEVQELRTELMQVFEQFKAKNDQQLADIKSGKSGTEHESALVKMNSRMDEINDAIKAIEKRADEMKAMAERPGSTTQGKQSAEMEAYKKGLNAYLRKGRTEGLDELHQKAMSVGSDPDGGYLVTPDTSGQIVKKVFDTTPFRSICSVQTIGTDALEGMEDRDEISTGWVTEIGARTETDTPEIGKWKIEVHEMYAEPRITQKMLDDAMLDVDSWLVGKISDKFARVQNDAFCNGNGVGKPRGFTTYTTAATGDASRTWGQLEHVATANNGDFPSSNPADKLFDLVYALKATYRNGATFVCPKTVLGKMRKFKGNTNYDYLWQPSIQEGQPNRFMGYALIESEDMPALATDSLSLAFGNFRRGYQIVDRQGIRLLRDNLTAKPYVKFYTTARVGGGVIDFEAIKLMKFGS